MRVLFLVIVSVFFATCSFAQVCGDRAIDAGEQCDDGNTSAGDGCDDQCRFEGGIVIKKVYGTNEAVTFEFAASYASSNFTLTKGSLNFSGYLPSSTDYTVTEVNIPSGWQLTNIDCHAFQINTPGNDVTLPPLSTYAADLPNNRVTISLRGAELMHCNFSNTLVGCSGASCAVCGNGVVDVGTEEECDNGAANSDTEFGPGACTTECKFAVKDCVKKARELASGCDQNEGSVSPLWLLLIVFGAAYFARGRQSRVPTTR